MARDPKALREAADTLIEAGAVLAVALREHPDRDVRRVGEAVRESYRNCAAVYREYADHIERQREDR